MSEMKRVELTTAPTSQKRNRVIRKLRTHRFNVTLGESNSETCPEYSYVDLVQAEKRANGDPLGEPDEDLEVAVIVQRFEAKYGPKGLQSGQKKRTQEMDDYYDPGGGYDEDDPFIDNTEEYDEVIPSSMTTHHGGFYINQGKLDFKSLNEDSRDVVKQSTKKKKIGPLDSENEEKTGTALAKKLKSMKRKKRLESRDVVDKKKRLSDTEEGELVIKKKKQKWKNPASNSSSQRDAKNSPVLLSTSATAMPTATTNSVTVNAPSKTTTTTIINGTAEVRNEMGKDEISAIEEIFSIVLRESVNEDSSSKSGEEGKGEQLTEKNTQLPPQLPPELLDAIENIKREAKETKEKKFFSAYINKLLLDIELGSHKLPWGSKTAIYSHLSEHLPYRKYTLQRRAKKLRESQEENQLKGPRQKLQEAIMKVMPSLEEQHELDVKRAKIDAEVKEEVADVVKEEMSTESEGEEKSENRKKARGPRRKFQWNSEIRDLLLSIVSMRMQHYSTFKSRSLTAEEFLKTYLNSDIKPLWPQGWMQTGMLYKESKKALEDLTMGGVPVPAHIGKQKKVNACLDAAPSITEMTPKTEVSSTEMTHNLEPKTEVSTTEMTHSLVPKIEDVIEVSGFMEDADKSKDTVVINLPNSVASISLASQTLMSSPASSSTVNVGIHLIKANVKTTTQITHNSSLSRTPTGSQQTVDLSLSSKEIVLTPLLEPSKISSAQRNDVISKPLNPASSQGTTSTSGGPVSSMALPPASLSSSNSCTVLETVDDLNNNGSPKLSLSSHSQQQVRTSIHQQKISVLQEKSVPQQQKLPQEAQSVIKSQQHKAAVILSPNVILNKDTPNSSWTNMSSIVPANKLTDPAVAAIQIAETSPQKQSMGLNSKNVPLQQNQMLLPQKSQQQLKMFSVNVKPNQNLTQKKQQLGNGSSSSSSVSTISDTPQVSLSGVLSVNAAPSSKQNPQNKPQYQDVQKKSSMSNLPLKSVSVTATPNSVQKFNPQHLQTGIVIRTSPPLKSKAATDFTGWIPGRPGNMRQPSLPVKLATSAARTSPMTTSSQMSKPPGLLSSSISTSASQTSTSSPQKFPVSAEVTALSPYEQIKTQVQTQEAIEDQALKNLAMALKLGGSSHSGLFDQDSDPKSSQKTDNS